jgi:hypothetical protein
LQFAVNKIFELAHHFFVRSDSKVSNSREIDKQKERTPMAKRVVKRKVKKAPARRAMKKSSARKSAGRKTVRKTARRTAKKRRAA